MAGPTDDAVYPHAELTRRVIGAAISVHRALGPGLLESAYEACLARELEIGGIPFARQVPLPLTYRGERVDAGYRLDLLIQDSVVVEVKAVDSLQPIHTAQLLTYLRLSGLQVGLLMNFNVERLIDGVVRKVVFEEARSKPLHRSRSDREHGHGPC